MYSKQKYLNQYREDIIRLYRTEQLSVATIIKELNLNVVEGTVIRFLRNNNVMIRSKYFMTKHKKIQTSNLEKNEKSIRLIENKDKIMALHAEGYSYKDIAVRFGVQRQTIYKRINQFKDQENCRS
jgi:transposase